MSSTKHTDAFSCCHPVVNFIYFAFVLLCAMLFLHPLCLLLSLACAFAYAVQLRSLRKVLCRILRLLPILVAAALLNSLLNHEGATILFYLPSGNPMTLESLCYGFAATLMLTSVLLWFSCYNDVMTSDKFLYLFGRVIPSLSLVLSMTLRFVPKFKQRFQSVKQAQACIGNDMSHGNLLHRMRAAISVFSIMVTWSLESSVETADSMKSRGYSLPGRTAFSLYRFDRRDRTILLWLLYCGFYILCGGLAGYLDFLYYPLLQGRRLNGFSLSFFLVYLLLCLTPIILNRREDRRWTHSQLKT